MKKTERRRLQALMNGMRYAQAVRFCRSILKEGEDAEALMRLALAYDQAATFARRRGKGFRRLAEQAELAIARALRISSDTESFHVRGIVLLHDGRAVEALADFRRAYKEIRNARYLVSIANAYRQLGRGAEALRHYRLARRSGTLPAEPIDYNIAQILFELGRSAEAKKMLIASLSTKPSTPFHKEILRNSKRLLALMNVPRG